MATFASRTGVKVRPHAKTHKSPVIAKMQIARGAVGQCVQKVAEAEVLAWAGVADILVSNKVVSSRKLARREALSRIAQVAPASTPLRAFYGSKRPPTQLETG